jgi:VWFA-related protein
LQGASQSTETKIFDVTPECTLVIQNDYGRVQIRPWKDARIQAEIRRIAKSDAKLANVFVKSKQEAGRIHLISSFYGYESESVYLDIRVPETMNVVVWGIRPAVEISGIKGYVRAYTQAGLITATDLSSSVSLTTEQGDVLFHSHIQPERDIRLESITGSIKCRLVPNLNIRGWVRAGGTLSWNSEVEFSEGQLEKQLGIGGPLLYAASLKGTVSVNLDLDPSDMATLAEVEANPPIPRKPTRTSEATSDPATETGNRAERGPAQDMPSEEPASVPSASSQSDDEPDTVTAYETSSSGTVESGYALKVDVNWTYLNVSVRDRLTNRSVPDLMMEDFVVHEDGELQQVEKFESTEAPISLLLLLDVSGSTRSYMDMIKEASIEFTQQIKENDHIAVATFNSRTRLVHDFSGDRRSVAKSIQRVKSGGGTAFYDALDRSVNDYMRGVEGRKAIVVFSDGVDNQLTGDYGNGSDTTFPELYRGIQESESIIYTILLDTEEGGGQPWPKKISRRGSLVDILGDIIKSQTGGGFGSDSAAYAEARQQMFEIAEQTGGRMYAPRDIYDLDDTYQEIADDLRIQYTLAYNSTNPDNDGSWREIRVRVRDRRDLAVRTRKGYYAEKG